MKRMILNTSRRTSVIVAAACLVALVALYIYNGVKNRNALAAALASPPSKTEILNVLRQQAMVATTEVGIKKLGEYNTAKFGRRFSLSDPTTWTWGERICIVPVDIKLKYGIDLARLKADDIAIEGNTVTVVLPQPVIVDSEYDDEIEQNGIFSLTTGLRETVAHEEQEEIAEQTYRYVVDNKELGESLKDDVKRNTQLVFASVIRGMGMEPVILFKE